MGFIFIKDGKEIQKKCIRNVIWNTCSMVYRTSSRTAGAFQKTLSWKSKLKKMLGVGEGKEIKSKKKKSLSLRAEKDGHSENQDALTQSILKVSYALWLHALYRYWVLSNELFFALAGEKDDFTLALLSPNQNIAVWTWCPLHSPLDDTNWFAATCTLLGRDYNSYKQGKGKFPFLHLIETPSQDIRGVRQPKSKWHVGQLRHNNVTKCTKPSS